MGKRTDSFAQDLYDRAGAFITASQLRQYLGCGKKAADRILSGLKPVYSSSYKKYYYREVAEVLAQGE